MAQAEIGALRVTLSMNVGEFIRNSQRVSSEVDRLGSNISKLHDSLSRSSILFTAGAMAAQRFASATLGILTTFTQFEKGMANVSTIVDTNVENMDAMTKSVLELGSRMPVTLTDLTAGLYDLRSAGIGADQAMALLEGSAKLAVAGLGTTAESVDIVTSAINAFGLKGEDALQVFNSIFKATEFGKTTIAELSRGFGAVAGTVAQAGVDLKEYLAAVAALTTTGLPAAEAHTQIRAAIAGLTRESELGKLVLDKLGAQTFKQLIEQSGGLVHALMRVRNVLQSNDANLIKLTGSTEAYNALLGLTGKQYQTFRAALESMGTDLGSLDEAFKKQEETLDSALKKMTNNLNMMAVEVGKVLKPMIESLSNVIRDLTNWFINLSPETQTLIVQIGALATVIAPAVVAIGFFLNGLATLIPVIGAVIGIIGALAAAIAALVMTGGPIAIFVIAASAAVTAWNIFKEEIVAIFDYVASYIMEKINSIVSSLNYMKDSISNALGIMGDEEFMKKWDEGWKASIMLTDQAASSIKSINGAVDEVVKYAPPVFNDGYVVPMSKGISDMAKLIKDEHNAGLRDAKRIIEEIQTPMEALEAKQWRINRAFEAGGLTIAQYGRAMSQATAMNSKNMDALASSVSSNLSAIFGESKAVAIATALINTYQGITRALATYPPPIAQAMAAIQAAAGFAQVANIRKQTASGGGGGGGGGGGEAMPATPGVGVAQSLTVEGINPNDLFTGATVKSMASALLDFQRDGGKVILT